MRRARATATRPIPRWMVYVSGALALFLAGFVCLMAISVRGFVADLQHLRFRAPQTVQFLPDPVGAHPHGAQPWFLVVGDSISAGISPGAIGSVQNHSWVGALAGNLHRAGFAWQPDDLACPTENTRTYYSGCPLNFTNPLLGRKAQHDVALHDIAAHRATLEFIVVELGANDLFGMQESHYVHDTAALITRLRGIIDELHRAAPGVPLLIANIYNPYAVDRPATGLELLFVNQAIRALSADEQAYLVDFADAVIPVGGVTRAQLCALVDCKHHDIHPTLAGEQVLAGAAQDALDRAGVLQLLPLF